MKFILGCSTSNWAKGAENIITALELKGVTSSRWVAKANILGFCYQTLVRTTRILASCLCLGPKDLGKYWQVHSTELQSENVSWILVKTIWGTLHFHILSSQGKNFWIPKDKWVFNHTLQLNQSEIYFLDYLCALNIYPQLWCFSRVFLKIQCQG